MLSYLIIRKDFQDKPKIEPILVDYYTKTMSPFLSIWFVKHKITPNSITIMMIISGIIGSILFSFPIITLKLTGGIFMHLWFILDCSDGEVARITKKFSQFGKELDFMAHIINHPLMNLTFVYSLICRYSNYKMTIMFTGIVLISAEMILRSLVFLQHIYKLKYKENSKDNDGNRNLHKLVASVSGLFCVFPNFALLFPFLFIFDYFFRYGYFIYLLLYLYCILYDNEYPRVFEMDL